MMAESRFDTILIRVRSNPRFESARVNLFFTFPGQSLLPAPAAR